VGANAAASKAILEHVKEIEFVIACAKSIPGARVLMRSERQACPERCPELGRSELTSANAEPHPGAKDA
jgi:hypothetical protein